MKTLGRLRARAIGLLHIELLHAKDVMEDSHFTPRCIDEVRMDIHIHFSTLALYAKRFSGGLGVRALRMLWVPPGQGAWSRGMALAASKAHKFDWPELAATSDVLSG